MTALLEFLNKAKETNNTITSLSECVQLANALKVESSITDDQQSTELAMAMMNLHQDFKARADNIKRGIAQMKQENQEHLEKYGPDRNFAARTTYLQSLIRRLGNVVEDFRRVQNGFAEKQKERLKSQYLIAKPNATQEELMQLDEKEKARPLLQAIFTIGDKTAKEVIIQAEKRRSTIESILKGIADLKELSDDFVAFITSTNLDVDRINTEVKQSHLDTKIAHTVIQKNIHRRIRIKKAKRAMSLTGIIILGFIIVYLICKIKQ
ncbi:hypothetical protein NEOKW01_0648 [Nematocida sp. AWRm80]|nr:hypothetical protein NEOKW01_0648 [Nematocida sp. AWRm80]